jgi:hypothetical protein
MNCHSAVDVFKTLAPTYFQGDKNDGTFRKKLPVKIGPDGRPFLFGPKIELCKTREYIKREREKERKREREKERKREREKERKREVKKASLSS